MEEGNRKLNVVLLGYGRIGLVHADSIVNHPRLKLLAIVARDEKKVKEIAAKYRMRGETSLKHLLVTIIFNISHHYFIHNGHIIKETEKVDGVVIASPTLTHPDYIKECADKKIPVFTDKPVAFLPEQISECYQITQKAGIPLFCGMSSKDWGVVGAA